MKAVKRLRLPIALACAMLAGAPLAARQATLSYPTPTGTPTEQGLAGLTQPAYFNVTCM